LKEASPLLESLFDRLSQSQDTEDVEMLNYFEEIEVNSIREIVEIYDLMHDLITVSFLFIYCLSYLSVVTLKITPQKTTFEENKKV
jgi:hypothetical protein